MIAFQVSLNGIPLTTAGSSKMSVLNTIVDAIGKLGPDSPGTKTKKNGYELHLTVGGLASESEEDPGMFLNWCERKLVRIGDEISIQIVETETTDEPVSTKENTPLRTEKRERANWELAKETYFKSRDKYE